METGRTRGAASPRKLLIVTVAYLLLLACDQRTKMTSPLGETVSHVIAPDSDTTGSNPPCNPNGPDEDHCNFIPFATTDISWMHEVTDYSSPCPEMQRLMNNGYLHGQFHKVQLNPFVTPYLRERDTLVWGDTHYDNWSSLNNRVHFDPRAFTSYEAFAKTFRHEIAHHMYRNIYDEDQIEAIGNSCASAQEAFRF